MNIIQKIVSLFRSRRFWATASGVLAIVFQDVVGLSNEQALTIAGMVAAWVVGDSISKTGAGDTPTVAAPSDLDRLREEQQRGMDPNPRT